MYFYMIIIILSFSFCDKYSAKNNSEYSSIFLHENWYFSEAGKDKWLHATVPGVNHLDLLHNGIIDEPFFGNNEIKQQWIDKKDWEYKTVFTLPENFQDFQKFELQFKGLDTYADVFLNDSLIIVADNMHREWYYDCSFLLKKGSNELRIYFHSPVKKGIPLHDSLQYKLPAINDHSEIGGVGDKKLSVFTRKAHYHYGWDWGPRFVTSGIWRPVYLIGWNEAKIKNVQYIFNGIKNDKALLTANFEIESLTDNPALITINEDSIGELLAKNITLKKGTGIYSVQFEIENPKLWWPNNMGEPHLYNFFSSLSVSGNTLQTKHEAFGLRDVNLVRIKDSIGISFQIEINNRPVFIKGANYIPSDNFVPRVTDEKYERIVESARKANLNMLRVWGGGIYENDIFYDLCDQKGILVWQDFMFACNLYPGYDDFFQTVEQEFRDNIKRLRNHPSIALWCGNNEILQAWHHWGWHHPDNILNWSENDSAKIWNDYLTIFHKMLPDALNELDPTRDYWPSSPASDTNVPQTLDSGDYHYWKNRNEKEPLSEIYEKMVPRFMSEYGKGSYPEFNSVKKFTTTADREKGNVRSYAKPKNYQQKPHKIKGIRNYLTRNFNLPSDFQSNLYLSQLVQLKVMETAICAHRRNKPVTMGTLFWMMNECWPVGCGSSIDYYGRWKAALYEAKRKYTPLLIDPHVEKGLLNIWIVSDKMSETEGKVKLELFDLEGNIIHQHDFTMSIPEDFAGIVYKKPLTEFLAGSNENDVILKSSLIEKDSIISIEYLSFVPAKKLKLKNPEISYVVENKPNEYTITLTSKQYAKYVFLTIDEPVGYFSDNYFDIIPGETKSIVFSTNEKVPGIKEKLEVYSLYDSYN